MVYPQTPADSYAPKRVALDSASGVIVWEQTLDPAV
jgi:hypothetical protein